MRAKTSLWVALLALLLIVLGSLLSRNGAEPSPEQAQNAKRPRAVPAASANGASPPTATPARVVPPQAKEEKAVSGITQFSAWLERHRESLAKGSALAPPDLAEGVRLAQARRPGMLALMREDPKRALELSVPWSAWVSLPPAVGALVEQPFSAKAGYEVLSDCRPKGERDTPFHTRYLALQDGTFRAYVYGRRFNVTSKERTPLQGIVLENQAALRELSVFELDDRDLAAVRGLLPEGNPRDRSWVSGERVGDPLAALVGGVIHYFGSREEFAAVADTIAAAEELPGPRTVAHAGSAGGAGDPPLFDPGDFMEEAKKASSNWTETNKNLLVIRVVYNGQATSTHPVANLASLQSDINGASNTLNTMSYGKTQLIATYPQVLSLPGTQSSYEVAGGHAQMTTDADNAVLGAGFNPDNFDFVCYWTPATERTVPGSNPEVSTGFPSKNGAFASLGSADSTFNGGFGTRKESIPTHEFGHNYGLGHANSWIPLTGGFRPHDPEWFDSSRKGYNTQQSGDGHYSIEHQEYGDRFDLMAKDFDTINGDPVYPNGHFSMNGKSHLNWIESGEVWEASTSGIYRVYRFDHPNARSTPGHRLGLKVTAQGEDLWVGLRRNYVNTPSLTTGAYLVWASQPHRHRQLDTTPFSISGINFPADLVDGALAVGASYIDPSGSVRLTNLGAGGSSPNEYVDIEVTFLDQAGQCIELFTDTSRTTPGLTGSYVDQSLGNYAAQDDWRSSQTIAGTRVDSSLVLPQDAWGSRAPLNLTGGTDADWEQYSVQWDGILVVNAPTKLATRNADGARLWIDLDQNGSFGSSAPEFFDNYWGFSLDGPELGPVTTELPQGEYMIRIQYYDFGGENHFELVDVTPCSAYFEMFTDAACQTPGLVGSYVDASLASYTPQDDWRSSQTIANSRTDLYPGFLREGGFTNGWGERSSLNLTGGSDTNWDSFSVQWDGYIKVNEYIRVATVSEHNSRMWIDFDGNGSFDTTPPEFINNNWGEPGPAISLGTFQTMGPGKYKIRIQYEARDGNADNSFLFAGVPTIREAWVDFAHAGTENGSFSAPWNTLAEGVAAVPLTGSVRIRPGTSTSPITISKPLRLEAVGGQVRIGPN